MDAVSDFGVIDGNVVSITALIVGFIARGQL